MILNNDNFTVNTKTINEIFEDARNYEIPLYQRNYSWGEEHVESLLDDIFDRTRDNADHYFGVIAITFHESDDHKSWIRIIDGQQRVTTSILIIDRLMKKIWETNQLKEREYFVDKFANIKFKNEIPTDDSETIKEIIKKKDRLFNFKGNTKKVINIIDNYLMKFSDQNWEEWLNTFLNKFKFAELRYSIANDKEMLIFENLNSKGSPLSEFDLIRNHIISISNLDSKITLLKFNRRIMNLFIEGIYKVKKKSSDIFEDFIRTFLIFKTKQKLTSYKSYDLYKNFRDFWSKNKNKYNSFDIFLEDLRKFLILYLEISPATIFKVNASQRIYNNIWFSISSGKNVHYPFLLGLFNKFGYYQDEKWESCREIEKNMFEWVKFSIKLIASEGTGQSLGGIILKLMEALKDDHFDHNTSSNIFKEMSPERGSFEQGLKKSFNTNKWVVQGLLDIIEYYNSQNRISKEMITYQNKKTLEHILPKAVNDIYWKNNFPNIDENHKSYLNKIGNLCYLDGSPNSGASNSPFTHKKDNYYNDSNSALIKSNIINGINIKPLIDYTEWNYENINKRTDQIIEIILSIFY